MLPDNLAVHLRAARDGGQAPPFDVRWLPSTTSTMDVASRLAHEGAPHGVVVVADEQTSGRGRRGTTWASPPGAGLYLSFIARPPIPTAVSAPPSLLTLAAGVAVREGIATATGLAADLKWPNDVIIGSGSSPASSPKASRSARRSGGDHRCRRQCATGLIPARRRRARDVARRRTCRTVDRGLLLSQILIALWNRLAMLDQRPG